MFVLISQNIVEITIYKKVMNYIEKCETQKKLSTTSKNILIF